MTVGQSLNQRARDCFMDAQRRLDPLRLKAIAYECGAQVLDFGIDTPGGLAAGVQLASICMAGQAEITLSSGDRSVWPGAWVQVATDHPLAACMLSQYAGWPVKHEKFFAMGSGPMRLCRGREELLKELGACDSSGLAVGTLECDVFPGDEALKMMAEECGVPASELYLAVAPTRSTAGCVQVVARSVETCLHKLHALGFDLSAVHSAHGLAPVPPPTPDFGLGIGRTNDAILYGGQVALWVDADDEQLEAVGKQLPSCALSDFGRPFAETFKQAGYDFYKIDPGLFSPAEITLMNFRSGRSWRFGALRGDLVAKSFATETRAYRPATVNSAMHIGILGSADNPYVVDLQRAAREHFPELSTVVLRFADLQVGIGAAAIEQGLPLVPEQLVPEQPALQPFDALVVRGMPMGSLEQVIFRMDCLQTWLARGIQIHNPPRSLEVAIDKWLCLQRLHEAGVPVPPTICCQTRGAAMQAWEVLGGDVLVKPLFGGEGRGILRAQDKDLAWRMFGTLQQLGQVMYVQQFVEHFGYDIRVLMVGNKHYAIRRVAPSGEWRTNISQGTRAESHHLTSPQLELAERARAAVGGTLLGIDLLPARDGRVWALEVNAVPGWRGLAQALNVDVAREFLRVVREHAKLCEH